MTILGKKRIVLVAVVVGILISAILVFSSNDVTTSDMKVSVDALTSKVTLTHANQKISTIKDLENVTEGDIVTTDSNGTALVEGEHKTYLDRDSTLTIKHMANGQGSFLLGVGRVWSRVEKLLEQGEYFEIETGNARAAVRGTSFGVSGTATTTKLLVAEGEVALALKSASGAVLSYTEEIVPAGKKAIVTGGDFEITDITKEDMDAWFMENNPGWVKPASTPHVKSEASFEVKAETKPHVQNFAIPREQKPESIPQTVEVKSVPSSILLAIDRVTPSEVTQGSVIVTISGKGFTKIRSLIFGKITASDYRIVSDSKIEFNVEKVGLTPGTYDIAMIDLSNAYVLKEQAFKVLPAPEPDSTQGRFNQ